jgi:radical SAM protein with 4Fe4S-binding SPASM domain
MTYQEIRGVIDQLRELGTLFICLSGGEPTMHPKFLEILRYINEKRMCSELFTNGVMIDRTMARELKGLKIFHIGVTMYGATPQTHDMITGVPGSFERTLTAATLLKENGLYVVFKFIMMHLNRHEYEMMCQMSDRLGILYKMDVTISPRDDLSQDSTYLQMDIKDMKQILWDHRNYDTDDFEKPMEGLIDFACGAGSTICSINAYGDLYPCVQMPILAGNIRVEPLVELWRNSKVLGEIRLLPRPERMQRCTSCLLRKYCQRCPGSAYMETGDLHSPSPSACRRAIALKELYDQRAGRPRSDYLPPGLIQRESPVQKDITFNRSQYFSAFPSGCVPPPEDCQFDTLQGQV